MSVTIDGVEYEEVKSAILCWMRFRQRYGEMQFPRPIGTNCWPFQRLDGRNVIFVRKEKG